MSGDRTRERAIFKRLAPLLVLEGVTLTALVFLFIATSSIIWIYALVAVVAVTGLLAFMIIAAAPSAGDESER